MTSSASRGSSRTEDDPGRRLRQYLKDLKDRRDFSLRQMEKKIKIPRATLSALFQESGPVPPKTRVKVVVGFLGGDQEHAEALWHAANTGHGASTAEPATVLTASVPDSVPVARAPAAAEGHEEHEHVADDENRPEPDEKPQGPSGMEGTRAATERAEPPTTNTFARRQKGRRPLILAAAIGIAVLATTAVVAPLRQFAVDLFTGKQEETPAASASAGRAPGAPSRVGVQAITPTKIRVWWTGASDNEGGFVVDNGNSSITVGPSVTNYDWGELAPGTYMCFRVRAVNAVGSSPFVPVDWACTTIPVAPSPPSRVTVRAASANTVLVEWTDNAEDAGAYLVDDGGRSVRVAANTRSYGWSGLDPGQRCFRVFAVDEKGGLSLPAPTIEPYFACITLP